MSADFGLGAALARLQPGRPLLIVDADEVVLRFADGFDRFLRERALFLDLASYRLVGNVRRLDDHTAILDVEVTALLEDFRRDLDWLDPVAGALEALATLGRRAGIVILTNISAEQAVARARNLAKLGLDMPLIANSGPKGPAVRHLANHAAAPTFFIDDIPQQLASAKESAPDVTRIHLIGDARLKALLAPSEHAHKYAQDWPAAEAFIGEQLDKI
jgi:FMN phosphatase YigB (HAD superfamily)